MKTMSLLFLLTITLNAFGEDFVCFNEQGFEGEFSLASVSIEDGETNVVLADENGSIDISESIQSLPTKNINEILRATSNTENFMLSLNLSKVADSQTELTIIIYGIHGTQTETLICD